MGVACIGAWHPSAVKWTVGRMGNLGYYHRTQINQKVYRVAEGAVRGVKNNAPVGGFPHYGIVNEDYMLLKGAVMGPRKRQVTIRKSMHAPTYSYAALPIEVKFIDTSSKIGHGKFQTIDEKNKFMGALASKAKKAE